jgi:hypothetical protein
MPCPYFVNHQAGRIFHRKRCAALLVGLFGLLRLAYADNSADKGGYGALTIRIATEATQVETDSPLDPNVFAGPENGENSAWSALYAVKRSFSENIRAKLAVAGGQEYERGELDSAFHVLESAITFANDTDTINLTAGKQRIIWSQDTTFHPLDFVGRYNFPKNDIGRNEDDPLLREGVLAANLLTSTKNASYEFLIADARENSILPADWQAAAKLGYRIEENYLTLIIEKSAQHSARLGLGLSRNLSDSWTFNFESVFNRTRILPVLQQDSAEVNIGPDLSLPARYSLIQDTMNTPRQEFLVALQHSFEGGSSVSFSYFFNGHGYTSSEWQSQLTALYSSAGTFTNARLLPIFPSFRVNPYGSFLGSWAFLAEDFYLRRNYVNLRWDSLNMFSFGHIEFDGVYGMDDHSANGEIAYTKGVLGNIIVKTYLILQRPTLNTETGLSPVRNAVGLNISVLFK